MKNPVLSENFLLDTAASQRLFHEYASAAPIIDYHNHLSAAEIAEDRTHTSITALWLETDHYKWRAMRANGIAEEYVSGSASDSRKFEMWARTVPYTIRNPIFHWTHLELVRAFGIDKLLCPATAGDVYDAANELLASPDFSARRLAERSGARILCTTDDPVETLEFHRRVRSESRSIQVLPTFRPDRVLAVTEPESFNGWLELLEACVNREIRRYDDLLEALDQRHATFHDAGCRLADHGIETFYAAEFSERSVIRTFDKVRSGRAPGDSETEEFRSAVSYDLARMNHSRGWVQQFHVGPIRNVCSRLTRTIGPDAGCDSVGDRNHAKNMARFFDRLDRDGILAKTILYNVNPRDNAVFATMAGNFNDGSTPGKMQYGPAWWFLDQEHGIIDHLSAISNYGLLHRFVGMVTDSRSILSLFSRHEYFRRILCNVLGRDMENGRIPNDLDWVGSLVRAISHENAEKYFGFQAVADE